MDDDAAVSLAEDEAARSYRQLAPLTITGPSHALPMDPALRHGRLSCGLAYYIKKNRKPEQRATLRLAVRVGSVQEEESQRGVAHMVEHLAFRATQSFDTHALIEFLESIGAAFGACAHACPRDRH